MSGLEATVLKISRLCAPSAINALSQARGSVHEPRLVSLFSAKLYNDALDVEDSHTGMEAGRKIL
jgi:hypothetical protein